MLTTGWPEICCNMRRPSNGGPSHGSHAASEPNFSAHEARAEDSCIVIEKKKNIKDVHYLRMGMVIKIEQASTKDFTVISSLGILNRIWSQS